MDSNPYGAKRMKKNNPQKIYMDSNPYEPKRMKKKQSKKSKKSKMRTLNQNTNKKNYPF